VRAQQGGRPICSAGAARSNPHRWWLRGRPGGAATYLSIAPLAVGGNPAIRRCLAHGTEVGPILWHMAAMNVA